jgi:hypothetical protein
LTGHFALSAHYLFRLALVRMFRPTRILKVKRCSCLCEEMPRSKRATKRVFYAELSSSSTVVNPQVRPEVPRFVPAVVTQERSAPRSTPASPSERGRIISSIPELEPIWPPTVPSPSSSSSSPPPPPYDFETQYALEGNYLATLLTSK